MEPFQRFISSRRAEQTKGGYARNIRLLIGDADRFLETARTRRMEAEDFLIDAAMKSKGRLSPATVSVRLAMVKSFLDFNEVPLNWKRVKATVPRARMVSLDRGPLVEEIRKAFDFAMPRERVSMLFMCSGGLRVGAFEYLKVEHVRRLASGIGLVRVYAGESEEYDTFVSKEAMDALDSYLQERERRGFEKIAPGAALIRDREYQRSRPRHLSTHSIQSEVWRLWAKAGIKAVGSKSEFKNVHGLRKFYRTQASRAMSREDVEVLMGHFLSYYKPSLEHLEEEYLKALPYLSIDEKFSLKVEIEAKDREHNVAWKDMRLEVLTLKDENRELKANQAEILRMLRAGAKVDPRLIDLDPKDLRPEDVDTSA